MNVKIIYGGILLKVAPNQIYSNTPDHSAHHPVSQHPDMSATVRTPSLCVLMSVNTFETGVMIDQLLSITSHVMISNTCRHQSVNTAHRQYLSPDSNILHTTLCNPNNPQCYTQQYIWPSICSVSSTAETSPRSVSLTVRHVPSSLFIYRLTLVHTSCLQQRPTNWLYRCIICITY